MAISLTETSPAQWNYISEGGATIVFSYSGPHHPILTGKVLRLRKTSPNRHRPLSNDQPALNVTFQQNVISRLLDSSYLPELQVVALQADWIEAFSSHHESSRPQERRLVSMIDCSKRSAVLAPDLIGGPPCAIEVKVNSHPLSTKNEMTASKSRNGVSYPILSTCHQRANRSKSKHAGPACMLT
jgi:inositol-pentakisphosphate 2-kinase